MRLLNPKVNVILEGDEKKEKKKKFCVFCCRNVNDLSKYGPLYELDGCCVHYFCLLTSDTNQGGDEDGIFGFQVKDIKRELQKERKQDQQCAYCKKADGILIKCCKALEVGPCEKVFHFSCGRDKGSRTVYRGLFPTTCKSHLPVSRFNIPKTWECCICLENDKKELVKSPCCELADGGKVYCHKTCMQRLAWEKGKIFICPSCRDVKSAMFRSSMKAFGIFIPDSDADYLYEEEIEMETLPNDAFSCFIDGDENDRCFYSTVMKNGTTGLTSAQVMMSPSTPLPIIYFHCFPTDSERIDGDYFMSKINTKSSKFDSGFLLFSPRVGKKQTRNNSKFELTLLVHVGRVNLNFSWNGKKSYSHILSAGAVAVIPPNGHYALLNETSEDASIFYIFKKFDGAYRWFFLTQFIDLMWDSPDVHICGVLNSWTQKNDEHQGFFKIESETVIPYAMKTENSMLFIVNRGEIRLRSTNHRPLTEEECDRMGGMNWDDEDGENKPQCMIPDILKEGSVFLIPINCCFAIENWTMDEVILFYTALPTTKIPKSK